MRERNGVAVGQRVVDLDGKTLGKVTRLFGDGFAVLGGFPILFRRDHVVRYEEVRGVRDGDLVVARSSRDLFDLAAGELPPSWRVPVPPAYPEAATPPEARLLVADVARGAISAEPADTPPPLRTRPRAAAEERAAPRDRRAPGAAVRGSDHR
jgi:hypothetical protein